MKPSIQQARERGRTWPVPAIEDARRAAETLFLAEFHLTDPVKAGHRYIETLIRLDCADRKGTQS